MAKIGVPQAKGINNVQQQLESHEPSSRNINFNSLNVSGSSSSTLASYVEMVVPESVVCQMRAVCMCVCIIYNWLFTVITGTIRLTVFSLKLVYLFKQILNDNNGNDAWNTTYTKIIDC